MSLITKETLLTHLQRAEMADSVSLPIEFFRDLVYQAMPREWFDLTDEERTEIRSKVQVYTAMDNIQYGLAIQRATEAKLKEKNHG